MRIITTKSHSCLITANAEETAAKQDHALGDVNNDSHINAVDASSVLSYYAKTSINQDDGFNEKKKLGFMERAFSVIRVEMMVIWMIHAADFMHMQ